MPLVDVSYLASDPDVAGDVFDVIRRREVVNEHGETTVVEQLFERVAGAVYPTGNNSLVREEAYQSGSKSMTVFTAFRLRTAAKVGTVQYQPDLVVWGGDRYIVREIKDYTRYGAGFIEAGCLSQDFVDEAPQVGSPPVVGRMDFTDPAQSGLIGALS